MKKATRTSTTTQKDTKPHLSDATNEAVREGQDIAHKLFDNGMDKFEKFQQKTHDYSDELSSKIKGNPISSILIAAGIGYILSSIFTKR